MTSFELIEAMGGIEDSMITQLVSRVYGDEPAQNRSVRRMFRMLIAAALIISALGLTAYAVSSLHQQRQQELRERYKVEQNNVSSLVEYPEPTHQTGVSLVSAISDGNFYRVYVNVSPVSEETVRESYDGFTFGYRLNDGSMRMAGPAYDIEKRDKLDKVQMYVEETQKYIEAPDPEQVYKLVLEEAYDPETRTLMLTFNLPLSYYRDMFPLDVTMISFDENMETETVYGTVTLELTQVQSREITFSEPYIMENPELGKTGYITGLTLYPIGATVYLDIPGSELFYDKEDLSREEYLERHSWVLLTDKVYKEFKLIFSDGSEKLLLGAMGTDYKNGRLCEEIQWHSTVDIDSLVAIEIMGQRIY